MFGFKVIAATGLMAYAALALTVSTPASLEECVPVALTWSNGTAPYYLAILPGGESSASPLVNFGDVGDVETYTWTVNITEGTAVTIRVTDSTGTINYSSEDTIQSGSTTCITSSSSTTAASGSSSASSTSSSTGSTTAAAAAASSVTSASSAATSAASSASSAVSSASSAAASSASSASSAAASSTTSKASSANKVVVGSFGALFLGAIGVVLA